MTMKEAWPYLSFFISLASLCIALYVMFRDRTRFDVSGSYKESFANIVDGVYIKIVNSGRRPITLYSLAFTCIDGQVHRFRIDNSIGQKAGTPFESRDLCHPCLSESEFFEFLLDRTNFDFGSFDLGSIASIEVESSTGTSKKVKGLAEEVKKNAHHLKSSM